MAVKCQFDCEVDEVWALLCDPDFRVERCVALGELSADCDVDEGDEQVTVRMHREVVRDLPSVLARIFNAKQTLDFVEKWQRQADGWAGILSITIKGQPVELGAKCSLLATPTGCEYVVAHHCKAKIPLVGGKVEKFVLAQTDAGAVEEFNYLKRKLSG
ncbi:MAG: DUF2505 domain-containing protein [Zhongshania sp.]|uniref:DUF2505 domain-containing protein n=1 Tax=Zhongshania sp. TaxID=1971902 RepID=UPI002604B097|nr:DUF2505 domain-containing protein [Zhongshania sp.]MDF1690940.1 DUF2505 domain-containing protein [Zhongshania sp.]